MPTIYSINIKHVAITTDISICDADYCCAMCTYRIVVFSTQGEPIEFHDVNRKLKIIVLE